ncbi:SDR family NAD(P)-dependent oxidoreductase [Pacificimonas flava]|uniref:Oxidoreductase, short chain dehydrogenase/reductase family n=1 Tax=Pacificimonas flava TaxID=1234595 RepID=M2U8D6_9SPHN|nr:SDR family NAD(P)-dependent oxidoreductase [Pacificimonas flava]EMD84237.1 Oxidoreductase, short chain dehydrogenase/reductase family [Pacificimonas flava]MBB5279886.1 NAD(P)-dependent dehydrogenase (short-subunit alcohol dehydrogenase family) [Pacificimonas flava]
MNFEDRVAIVTGAGGGLGRAYALSLAARGTKVVVNDLGGARDGTGGSSSAAAAVVEEIEAAGGTAISNSASVTDRDAVQAMVDDVMAKWGRIDILINNAGVLRDKTFAKMTLDDFAFVVDVHLMGSVNCTKAVWQHMRDANYGRIVMTGSSTGCYGNFGQTNYGAAKLGLVGFMKSLAIEGAKNNIHVNSIIPVAGTRMTEDIMPEQMLGIYAPEKVAPAVVFLASDEAPTNTILGAGAGGYHAAHVTLTKGIMLKDEERTAETIASRFAEITDRSGETVPQSGAEQGALVMGRQDELN